MINDSLYHLKIVPRGTNMFKRQIIIEKMNKNGGGDLLFLLKMFHVEQLMLKYMIKTNTVVVFCYMNNK